jgi:hypothetical protein
VGFLMFLVLFSKLPLQCFRDIFLVLSIGHF